MSLTGTTLAAACGASDLTLSITSTSSGFPAVGALGLRQLMMVGGEKMLIDQVVVAGVVKVLQRGYDGTVAQAHSILENVLTSSAAADFLDVPSGASSSRPPFVDDILTIGEDTTFTAAGTPAVPGTSIPLPIKNTTYLLRKASAAAVTLISGVGAQVGLRLTFYGAVAVANTVTYAAGFNGDTTSSDVATFAAKVGSTLTIECGPTGLWAVVGQNGITLA